MVRDFGPGDRVAGRVEIAYGGPLRGSTAGVDVMGDGALVAFAGGVRRRKLEPLGDTDVFELVRRELTSAE